MRKIYILIVAEWFTFCDIFWKLVDFALNIWLHGMLCCCMLRKRDYTILLLSFFQKEGMYGGAIFVLFVHMSHLG